MASFTYIPPIPSGVGRGAALGRLQLFMSQLPRTYVYIDGFNLYYGALKNTSYKWLNVVALSRLLLPKSDIQKVKYFTARVSPRPSDPTQGVRQEMFLRALMTLPEVEIIYGHFLSHEVSMPLANPPQGGPKHARVIKTEEKGSDVNLATHMLNDGWKNLYDVAVVVSNDSDLAEPIRILRQELKKGVGILNPHNRPSNTLKQLAMFVKPIRAGVLTASQFSPTLQDATGTFNKPSAW
jgi:uncharacterized LabA/DUF88 family protein